MTTQNTVHSTQLSELESLQTADLDAGEVFGGKASGTVIKGFASPCAYTPGVDAHYLFHDTMRDIVVWFLTPTPDPLYVCGPTGCGKTSLLKQVAARLHYPVFEITGHGRLEFSEIVGHLSVKNGGMEFQYGPLALAMRYGGLLVFNEIDITDPSTLCGLNGVLDGEPLTIPENGGEIIKPHPMFRFAATGNSNGGSDETGLYQGVLRQNLAALDRYWFCEVGYPSPDAEKKLLATFAPVLPEDIRDRMVSLANEVREQFIAGQSGASGFEITFSTRSLLRWADLTLRFQPLARQGIQPISYALDRALAFRACSATRTALHELVQRIFPANLGERAGA